MDSLAKISLLSDSGAIHDVLEREHLTIVAKSYLNDLEQSQKEFSAFKDCYEEQYARAFKNYRLYILRCCHINCNAFNITDHGDITNCYNCEDTFRCDGCETIYCNLHRNEIIGNYCPECLKWL